ncbi:MAG: J domain-containing protein [Pirellulales bacterium]
MHGNTHTAPTLPHDRPPHLVLGLAATATAEQARAAYLEAVRRHPPDREPERFRELHAAMQAFCDPVERARQALVPPRQRPDLVGIVAAATARPPRLPVQVLLALGNQDRQP